MDRGEFIKDGFTCQRGANGGWSVFPLYGVEKAYFTSFTEMCDWLEDQHEGLVIGEMGRKGVRPPETDNSAAQDPRVNEMPVGPYPRAEPAQGWQGGKGVTWHTCSFGCNDEVTSAACPIHTPQVNEDV